MGGRHINNLSGQQFYKWTAISPIQGPYKADPHHLFYNCRCECGYSAVIRASYLIRGLSKSCKYCMNKQEPGVAAFKRIYRHYKRQAKYRGFAWELNEIDFRKITSSPCHYTGLPPSNICTTAGGSYRYNGIDRINSKDGYNINNCVACNGEVNRMKMDMTYEQFLTLCQLISKVTSNISDNKSLLKVV